MRRKKTCSVRTGSQRSTSHSGGSNSSMALESIVGGGHKTGHDTPALCYFDVVPGTRGPQNDHYGRNNPVSLSGVISDFPT